MFSEGIKREHVTLNGIPKPDLIKFEKSSYLDAKQLLTIHGYPFLDIFLVFRRL